MWLLVAVAVLGANRVSGQGDATLQDLATGVRMCPNISVSFSCRTTVTGVLEWENVNGETVRFTTISDDVGASGSLGPVSITLMEENSNTLVSRATVTITENDEPLTCTNDANTVIAPVDVMGIPSNPRNFSCSQFPFHCTWEPPADTPNCCVKYMLVMTNATESIRLPVGDSSADIPTITSETVVGVYCEDGLGRESAISKQLLLSPPADPSTDPSTDPLTNPSTETSSTDSSSSPSFIEIIPWWIWLIIGLLVVALIIAIILIIVFILLYIKKTNNDSTNKINDQSELKQL